MSSPDSSPAKQRMSKLKTYYEFLKQVIAGHKAVVQLQVYYHSAKDKAALAVPAGASVLLSKYPNGVTVDRTFISTVERSFKDLVNVHGKKLGKLLVKRISRSRIDAFRYPKVFTPEIIAFFDSVADQLGPIQRDEPESADNPNVWRMLSASRPESRGISSQAAIRTLLNFYALDTDAALYNQAQANVTLTNAGFPVNRQYLGVDQTMVNLMRTTIDSFAATLKQVPLVAADKLLDIRAKGAEAAERVLQLQREGKRVKPADVKQARNANYPDLGMTSVSNFRFVGLQGLIARGIDKAASAALPKMTEAESKAYNLWAVGTENKAKEETAKDRDLKKGGDPNAPPRAVPYPQIMQSVMQTTGEPASQGLQFQVALDTEYDRLTRARWSRSKGK